MSQDKPSAPNLSGEDFVIGIVAASYNNDLVEALLKRCIATLRAAKVKEENIHLRRVPGSGELPYVTYMAAELGEYDCLIALGVVIAGDTPHHEIIAHATAKSLIDISLRTEVPVINGIVVTLNRAQAEARCLGELDRGTEFGSAALVMAQHRANLGFQLDDLTEEEEIDFNPDEPWERN